MKLKLNADLGGFLKGKIIGVEDDGEGNPLSLYWRNRLKDSKMDSCVEIVEEIVIEIGAETKAPKNRPKVK